MISKEEYAALREQIDYGAILKSSKTENQEARGAKGDKKR